MEHGVGKSAIVGFSLAVADSCLVVNNGGIWREPRKLNLIRSQTGNDLVYNGLPRA